jgi:hypothetical protein
MSTVKFKVDRKPVAIDATAEMPLLYALRNDLGSPILGIKDAPESVGIVLLNRPELPALARA